MRLTTIVVALVLLPVISAVDRPLTVCEVLQRGSEFNHKLVAIRGIQMGTDEGAWLDGKGCQGIRTVGRTQAIIWLETAANRRVAAGFEPVDLARSAQRINAEISKAHYDRRRDQLHLTYVGLFQMADSEETRGEGFGHLNSAIAALIVKDVMDVVVEGPRHQHE
jgi:hypothetical protein